MREFQYPPDVLQQLREAWAIPGWREPEPEPLPSDAILCRILEVAYHASFTTEERRATQLSIRLCDPTQEREALIFSRPREFSVHEIMRLAPAGDVEADSIGIHVDASGDIKIWGLASEGWSSPTFMVLSPGTIEVRRFSKTIFALQAGSTSPSAAIDAYFINDVFEPVASSLFHEAARGRGPMGNAYDPTREYGAILLELLVEATRHGHGATVFVIPDSDANSLRWKDLLHIKYACRAQSLWPSLRVVMRGMVRALSLPLEGVEDDATDDDESRHAHRETSLWPQRMARLSRVDGGVLITDHYQLLGFGVEVVASADDLRTVRVNGTRDEDIEHYGTRHRSAFRLCHRYPEAVTFVCSQDGGIKCVRNQNGVVTLQK